MDEIGVIVRLQVQTASLKVGSAPRRRYDPAPLRSMPALAIDAGGAGGLTVGGERVGDVHHREHPASKHREGVNGLSIGFTSHYAAMRERFGGKPPDGLAGENILVASDRRWREEDLAPGLVIETVSGQRLRLVRVVVAAPCVEFTRWVMAYPEEARPDRTVTDGVRFLDDGLRGYYATYRGAPARGPRVRGERGGARDVGVSS